MKHVVGLLLAWTFMFSSAKAAERYVPVDLGTLGGHRSEAVAVSDNNIIVGDSWLLNGTQHAFLWTKTRGMVDLGTLGGDSSYAVARHEHEFCTHPRKLRARFEADARRGSRDKDGLS